jgi:uncharacterized membrane protein YgdD (TMEM256/DUF423 family)
MLHCLQVQLTGGALERLMRPAYRPQANETGRRNACKHSNLNFVMVSNERRVRWLAAAGALFALAAVAAGAFGAHALKSWLAADRLLTFETAVRYQGLHALGLFACAWVLQSWPSRIAFAAGVCFTLGIVLFCGSLYALALLGEARFGAITPVGGIAFLAGWTLLTVAILNSRKATGPTR